ncbi:DUF3039 domain-containing protein [Arcanobacterium canis]
MGHMITPSYGPSEPGHLDPGQPESVGGTAVLEEVREEVQPGDNERYAHYVRKDKIIRSAIEGRPVVALCGKVWVPMRNPDRFPVCPTCKAIHESMKNGGGDSSWPFGPNVPGNQ